MSPRPSLVALSVSCFLAILPALPAWGQSNSGLFGSRGLNSSSSSGGLGSSGLTSGFGSLGGTQGQTGAQGGTGQASGLQNGLTGQSTQTGGTGRTSALSGGLNGSGRTSNLGQTNGTGNQGTQGLAAGANRNQSRQTAAGRSTGGQANNQQPSNDNPTTGPRIRPQVSFPFRQRNNQAIQDSLRTRINSMKKPGREYQGIEFDLDPEGIVTLRGTAPDENTKRLVASLVRLEPGVRSVKNQISVPQAAASRPIASAARGD